MIERLIVETVGHKHHGIGVLRNVSTVFMPVVHKQLDF
jgi:hypothetical protein